MNRKPRYIIVTDIEEYPACINADFFLSAIRYKNNNGSMYTRLKWIGPGMDSPEELKVLDTPQQIYEKLKRT